MGNEIVKSGVFALQDGCVNVSSNDVITIGMARYEANLIAAEKEAIKNLTDLNKELKDLTDKSNSIALNLVKASYKELYKVVKKLEPYLKFSFVIDCKISTDEEGKYLSGSAYIKHSSSAKNYAGNLFFNDIAIREKDLPKNFLDLLRQAEEVKAIIAEATTTIEKIRRSKMQFPVLERQLRAAAAAQAVAAIEGGDEALQKIEKLVDDFSFDLDIGI